MIAVDASVIVRLLIDDDDVQSPIARALDEGASLVISDAVLCEFAWVLLRGCRVPKAAVADALAGLLATEQVTILDRDVALTALSAFRDGRADFADYLIRERARAQGAAAVATFDGDALGEPGFVHPDPAHWPEDLSLHERPTRYGRPARRRATRTLR